MLFRIRHYRGGKLLQMVEARNTFTREGAEHLLRRWLSPDAVDEPRELWYVGLVSAGSIALGDTAATKTVTEFTDYTFDREGLAFRFPGTHELQDGEYQTDLRSTFDFSITGPGTIRGVFIESDDTPGGPPPAGTILWAGATLATPLTVSAGDTLDIETYFVRVTANDSLGNP